MKLIQILMSILMLGLLPKKALYGTKKHWGRPIKELTEIDPIQVEAPSVELYNATKASRSI